MRIRDAKRMLLLLLLLFDCLQEFIHFVKHACQLLLLLLRLTASKTHTAQHATGLL
jgi:hypothetical protein